MRGFLGGFLFFALFLYGAYTTIVAAQHYFALSGLVEEVVGREMPKLSGWGWPSKERELRIRDAILATAQQAGIALDRDGIAITEQGGVLAVRATYRYPLVVYRGTAPLTLPIWTAQTFTVPGGR